MSKEPKLSDSFNNSNLIDEPEIEQDPRLLGFAIKKDESTGNNIPCAVIDQGTEKSFMGQDELRDRADLSAMTAPFTHNAFYSDVLEQLHNKLSRNEYMGAPLSSMDEFEKTLTKPESFVNDTELQSTPSSIPAPRP